MSRPSVAVVGAGVMGLFSARALASLGADVALYERDAIGNRDGSSWGDARIFRIAHDHRLLIRAALQARNGWDALEAEVGEELIAVRDGIDYGTPERLALIEAACAGEDIELERLTQSEAAQRWPQVLFDSPVLRHGCAGVIHSSRVVGALRNLLLGAGVDLHEGSRVVSVHDGLNGVTVATDQDTRRFDAAVIALGAWTQQLVEHRSPLARLTVTEEFPFEYELDQADCLPVAVHYTDLALAGDGAYWLPTASNRVKVGAHGSGPRLADPDARARVCPPSLAAGLDAYVTGTFRGVNPTPLTRRTSCLYTSSDDGNFVVRRDGNLVLLAGFSGEGFKFAPLVGEVAASLIVEPQRQTPLFPQAEGRGVAADPARRDVSHGRPASAGRA